MRRIFTVILILSLLLFSACKGSNENSLDEFMSLGQKYLIEENYEEAIIAFEKAIAIDERCVEAYLGLADAYVGKGDLDKALEALARGFKVTEDVLLEDKYKNLLSGSFNTGDFERIDGALATECEEAIQLYQNGKYAEAEQLIATQIVDKLLLSQEFADKKLYFGNVNQFGIPEGIGLYVYGGDAKVFTSAYVGELKSGIRSGQGMACFNTRFSHGYYIGGWLDDLPEGYGEEYSYQTVKISNHLGEQWTEDQIILSKGQFKQGLAHGEFATGNLGAGGLRYKFSCLDGVPQSMGKTTTGWWIETDSERWNKPEDEIMCYSSEDWINWEEAWHQHSGLRCVACDWFSVDGHTHPWMGYIEGDDAHIYGIAVD